MMKIHVYMNKQGKIKYIKFENGLISIKLDPSYVLIKNGKPYAVYSPISGLTIRLFPEITVYHYK